MVILTNQDSEIADVAVYFLCQHAWNLKEDGTENNTSFIPVAKFQNIEVNKH